MKKLKQFGIVAVIYLLLAFIELDVNPLEWSTGSKIVVAFAVFAYVVMFMFDTKNKTFHFSEVDEEER